MPPLRLLLRDPPLHLRHDYCLPEKECACQGAECGEDPCEIFRKVQFPVDEFFPPNSVSPKTATSYQEARGCCCS